MASRAEQKAKARAERIAYEQKLAEEARRKQRLARLAGVVIAAAAVIVAAIVISSSNSTTAAVKVGTKASNTTVKRVSALLAGIPESGDNILGKSSAPIQITEFGDLECSACDYFALPTTLNTSAGVAGSGLENQLISTYVKTGQASLEYRSFETASGGAQNPAIWTPQQAGALAAGLQGKAWYYIELFYNEQLAEDSNYNQAYLDNIAKQIPGLNYSKWLSDINNPNLAAQVTSDGNAATSAGYRNTPTIVIKGPKGQAPAISGVPSSWSQIQTAIKQVGG